MPPQQLIPIKSYLPAVREREQELKMHKILDFDLHHGAKELSNLLIGIRVWTNDPHVDVMVQAAHSFPRSYIVCTPNGEVRRKA